MINDVVGFEQTLSQLFAHFGKGLTPLATRAWLEGCKSLDDGEFDEAAIACIIECDRLPRVKDFIGLLKGDEGATEEVAIAEAWQNILGVLPIVTSTSPEHLDRRAEVLAGLQDCHKRALADLGGFSQLGCVDIEDLHWKQKEFEKRCKTYLEGNKAAEKSDRYLENSLSNRLGHRETGKLHSIGSVEMFVREGAYDDEDDVF